MQFFFFTFPFLCVYHHKLCSWQRSSCLTLDHFWLPESQPSWPKQSISFDTWAHCQHCIAKATYSAAFQQTHRDFPARPWNKTKLDWVLRSHLREALHFCEWIQGFLWMTEMKIVMSSAYLHFSQSEEALYFSKHKASCKWLSSAGFVPEGKVPVAELWQQLYVSKGNHQAPLSLISTIATPLS